MGGGGSLAPPVSASGMIVNLFCSLSGAQDHLWQQRSIHSHIYTPYTKHVLSIWMIHKCESSVSSHM